MNGATNSKTKKHRQAAAVVNSIASFLPESEQAKVRRATFCRRHARQQWQQERRARMDVRTQGGVVR